MCSVLLPLISLFIIQFVYLFLFLVLSQYFRLWTAFESGKIVDITSILLKSLDAISLTASNVDSQVPTDFELNVASIGMLNAIIMQMTLEAQLLIKVSEGLRKGPMNPQVI